MIKYAIYPKKHKFEIYNTKREVEQAAALLDRYGDTYTIKEVECPEFDYFVVGDYSICGKISSCLIQLAGTNEEKALKVLDAIKLNPPSNCLGNIQLKKEKREDCWWNQENP